MTCAFCNKKTEDKHYLIDGETLKELNVCNVCYIEIMGEEK